MESWAIAGFGALRPTCSSFHLPAEAWPVETSNETNATFCSQSSFFRAIKAPEKAEKLILQSSSGPAGDGSGSLEAH